MKHSVKSVLSTHQHGFVRGRSINTNLLELTSHIIDGFSAGCQTDVVFTDFSKAFDVVNHKLLLKKLDIMGFPQSLVLWISSYLQGRTQQVSCNGALSYTINVTSGVPQGSHLGPILFTLFINDLPPVLRNTNILLYADDVKLFSKLTDGNSHLKLQNDLDNFVKWCMCNGLCLNLDKCKVMSFSRRAIKSFLYS